MTTTRYMFHSLLSGSSILLFAGVVAVLCSLLLAVGGAPLATESTVIVVGFLVGGSLARYQKWEVGHLVPGLNSGQLRLTLQCVGVFVVMMFAAFSCSAAVRNGTTNVLFETSLTVVALMTGMLHSIGCRWPLSLAFLVLFFFAMAQMLPSSLSLGPVVLPEWIYSCVGLVLLVYGAALLRLFCQWSLQPQMSRTSVQSVRGVDDPQIDAFVGRLEWTPGPAKIRKLVMEESLWKSAAVTLLVIYGIAEALMHDENHAVSSLVKMTSCLLILATPLNLFLHRCPQSFERLWMMGHSPTRVATTRKKMQLSCGAVWGVALISFFAVGIQSRTGSTGWVEAAVLILIAVGTSAAVLFFLTRSFFFWQRHGKFAVSVFLVVVATAITLIQGVTFGGHDNPSVLANCINREGAAVVVFVSFVFAALAWGVCLVDGGRAMARNPKMMEVSYGMWDSTAQ